MQCLHDLMLEHNVSDINSWALTPVPFYNRWGMTTEDEKKAVKGPVYCPDDQWKSTNWMKLLQQQDWHNSRSIHPGLVATERIKWQITCPNKAVMKAKNQDHAFYRQVVAECLDAYNDSLWKLINHGHQTIPQCLYFFLQTK